MSDQSVNSLKILKEEVEYYLVDPGRSMAALNNYHKNKRIDKYLELSKVKTLTLGKKEYKKKDFLNEIEFKALFNIQREIERLSSKLSIITMNAQSITKRLEAHGENMTATEMDRWTTQWNKLNKEYDAILLGLEKRNDEARYRTMLATFGITKPVFDEHYTKLLDHADGLFNSIINLYDTNDPVRVKDVIGPMIDPSLPDPNVSALKDQVKSRITDKIDKLT